MAIGWRGRIRVPTSKAVFQRATALPQPPSVPEVPRGPGPRWETRLNGQVFAAPAVADGIVTSDRRVAFSTR